MTVTSRRSKFPVDVGPLQPRLDDWMRDNLEVAARPRRLHDVTFSATPGTELRLRHRVPGKPTGWVVRKQSAAGSVYESRAPDKHYVYLKSDTASLTVRLEVS